MTESGPSGFQSVSLNSRQQPRHHLLPAIIILLLALLAPVFAQSEDPSSYKRSAEAFLEKHDYKNALRQISIYIKSCPGDYSGYQMSAKCSYELKDYEKAEKSARKALSLYKNDIVSACMMGDILLRKGQLDQSLDYFRQAIDINSDYPMAHLGAGQVYLKKHELPAAKKEIKLAKEAMIIPDVPFYKSIAESYQGSGYTNEAILTYKELLSEYPENAEIQYLTGKAYQGKGDGTQACLYFKKAIELDRKNGKYHEALGEAYLSLKNSKDGIRELEQAASMGKVSPTTSFRLGLSYFSKGDLKRAAPLLKTAVKEKPDLIDARLALSAIYLEEGKYKECLEECKIVVKSRPDNDTGYYNMSCAYAMLGKKELAIANLKKAIVLLPQNKEIAKEEKCFKSLRALPEFKELMK